MWRSLEVCFFWCMRVCSSVRRCGLVFMTADLCLVLRRGTRHAWRTSWLSVTRKNAGTSSRQTKCTTKPEHWIRLLRSRQGQTLPPQGRRPPCLILRYHSNITTMIIEYTNFQICSFVQNHWSHRYRCSVYHMENVLCLIHFAKKMLTLDL